MSRSARAALLPFAILSTALAGAADGFYVGASGGSIDLSWDPPSALGPPVLPPPIMYPVCGGTAAIQYGLGNDGRFGYEEGSNTGLAPLFGWRSGRFALELSLPPDMEALSAGTTVAGQVTQATCTTSPTVAVFGYMSTIERVSVESTTLAALYDFTVTPKVRVQLRAQATAWEGRRDTTFNNVVVEIPATGIVTEVPLATSNTTLRDEGVDAGYGIGLAVALSDRFDLRLAYSHQALGDDAEAAGFTFGFVYGF